MRILHFLPVYLPAWHYGGPVLSVSRLCEGLVSQGVEVRVITTNAGLPDFPEALYGSAQIINGVEVFYYQVDQQYGPIRSKHLVDSLANHIIWADLVHLSSIWQPLGVPVQNAAHRAGIPDAHRSCLLLSQLHAKHQGNTLSAGALAISARCQPTPKGTLYLSAIPAA